MAIPGKEDFAFSNFYPFLTTQEDCHVRRKLIIVIRLLASDEPLEKKRKEVVSETGLKETIRRLE